jgi:hypothetical protein
MEILSVRSVREIRIRACLQACTSEFASMRLQALDF